MSKESRLLHTIRLAGPWEFQVAGGANEWQTIKAPAKWNSILELLQGDADARSKPSHFHGAKGDLIARRRFQRPTGLDGGVRVRLVMDGTPKTRFKLRINDVEVPSADGEAAAFDITDSLQAGNVATVEFDIDRLISDDAFASAFTGALIEIRTVDDSRG